jgi:molybdopterin converting factor small subunit
MESVSDGGDRVETREPSGVVTVRYWAAARAAAGVATDDLPVPGPVTLAHLRDRAVALHPETRLEAVLGVCSALVGDRPVGSRDPASVEVRPGEVVEFLPPFAGG